MIRPARIRRRTGTLSTGHMSYEITIPWQIAEVVPDGMEFQAEATDEGILLRPVRIEPQINPPAWARETT